MAWAINAVSTRCEDVAAQGLDEAAEEKGWDEAFKV